MRNKYLIFILSKIPSSIGDQRCSELQCIRTKDLNLKKKNSNKKKTKKTTKTHTKKKQHKKNKTKQNKKKNNNKKHTKKHKKTTKKNNNNNNKKHTQKTNKQKTNKQTNKQKTQKKNKKTKKKKKQQKTTTLYPWLTCGCLRWPRSDCTNALRLRWAHMFEATMFHIVVCPTYCLIDILCKDISIKWKWWSHLIRNYLYFLFLRFVSNIRCKINFTAQNGFDLYLFYRKLDVLEK